MQQKQVPKNNQSKLNIYRAHTVYNLYKHKQMHFQGTVGAIRGMFGLCYLNK